MKISTQQLEAIRKAGGQITPDAEAVDDAVIRLTDKELILSTTRQVENMPDREEMIADLKARIASGEYNPSGEEIADAMIRRSQADKIR